MALAFRARLCSILWLPVSRVADSARACAQVVPRLHSPQALGAVPQIIDASQPASRPRAVVQLRAAMRQWLESGGRRLASPGLSRGEAGRNPSGVVAPRAGPLAIPAALTARLHAAPEHTRPAIVTGRERERLDRELDDHRGPVGGRAAYGEHLVVVSSR